MVNKENINKSKELTLLDAPSLAKPVSINPTKEIK